MRCDPSSAWCARYDELAPRWAPRTYPDPSGGCSLHALLLENLTEDAILAIDRQGDVANCAVTEYRFEPSLGPDGGLVLERYNFVTPLEEAGAPVTSEPDLNVAAR